MKPNLPKRTNIDKSLRTAVIKRDSSTCRYCGQVVPNRHIELDHVHPVSRGGQNTYSNLVVSCYPCNMRKAAHSGGFMIANVPDALKTWWQDFLTNPPIDPRPSPVEGMERDLFSEAMRLLGKRKSEKKAAAVRENGKKGGRPPKPKEDSPPPDSP